MQLAVASLLARHWPGVGTQQETTLAVAGMFLRGGMAVPDVQRIVTGVETIAGDLADVQKRAEAVADTAAKLEAGEPTTGGPQLIVLLGDEAVARRVVACLGRWLKIAWDLGAADRQTPIATATVEAGERPRIKVPVNQFYDAAALADALWQGIQVANTTASLFRFGDSLAWIERDTEDRPFARRLKEAHLTHWLRQRLYFYTPTKTGDLPVATPPLVTDLMVTPSPPLPVLGQVVNTPVLTPDGRVHATPGYDAATRGLLRAHAGLRHAARVARPPRRSARRRGPWSKRSFATSPSWATPTVPTNPPL